MPYRLLAARKITPRGAHDLVVRHGEIAVLGGAVAVEQIGLARGIPGEPKGVLAVHAVNSIPGPRFLRSRIDDALDNALAISVKRDAEIGDDGALNRRSQDGNSGFGAPRSPDPRIGHLQTLDRREGLVSGSFKQFVGFVAAGWRRANEEDERRREDGAEHAGHGTDLPDVSSRAKIESKRRAGEFPARDQAVTGVPAPRPPAPPRKVRSRGASRHRCRERSSWRVHWGWRTAP